MQEVWRAQALMLQTVFYRQHQLEESAEFMLNLAARARKSNILALQNVIATGKLEPFLERGLTMVIDAVPVERIEALLHQDMHALIERHNRGVAIFRKAADIAPAMGLIGTLIGLVQMLAHLSDPSKIGPSMAIALLTTLYGAALSYLVFTPLASKLDRNTSEEILANQIYLEGILSIAKQENPRQLETVMNSILPPASRVRYFD
jgi:chemotaxis protein MotA